jgi:hypothetical protein
MKYNTIVLKNYLHIREEYKAAAAIIPGMLVEMSSTSGYVQKHANAGRTALPMFAIEDALQGKGINQNLAADNYAAGDQVQVWIPTRGDIVYALLADEEKVVIGDFLESNGAGYLRKVSRSNESWESADANPGGGQHSIYDMHIVGVALEAKDLTSLDATESSAATATTTQYIQVRIM